MNNAYINIMNEMMLFRVKSTSYSDIIRNKKGVQCTHLLAL